MLDIPLNIISYARYRTLEIPCQACPARPISLRTSKKFQFTLSCLGKEEYPVCKIYFFYIS